MDLDKKQLNLDFDTVTIDLTGIRPLDNLDITYPTMNNVGLNGNLISQTITANGANVFTWTGDNFGYVKPSNKLSIQGDDADIEVNGVSLMQILRDMQQRLNMLEPNPGLEQQWQQLRDLGDQYRQLEKELLEKNKVWHSLKQMPPPEII